MLNYQQKNKKVYSIFSKIAGLGSAHNIFLYYNLSVANSVAVCVLALSLAKQSTTVINKNTKNIVNAMR